MRGVVLIAIGGVGYLRWANNMAVSLKTHSPNLPIQILVSKDLFMDALSSGLFDVVTLVQDEMWKDENGRLFPAKLKTSFYDLVDFEEFIYLDVDGCILKDITPLFECKEDLCSDVQGVYDTTQGEVFNHLKWAKPNVIWEHFGLKKEDRLPAINSSFLFVRKGQNTQDVFNLAHELLMNNPLPYEKHWYVWGRRKDHKVSQPDELYFNVAMAKLGIIPSHNVVIVFRMINDLCEFTTYSEVREKFYGVGLFGQLETNHRRMREIYNTAMKEMWRDKTGQPFHDKCEILSKSKFAVI